ncbi:MAG TPA: MFS transporter, partial [Streptosporangiaceae bacterium]|nr:MFS transporter [Streptosporangiaceae bacterium]
MSGATFAAAFLITQEFQFARGYSPISTGLRLLPFFATPMVISPLAGAISDKIGRRPIMVTGLALQALGFAWVAARGSLHTSWAELVIALLVAGVGISMALPTVPTAVLNAVPVTELGQASGINYMAQRFGTVFAIAIGSAVFSAYGHLGSPAAVTAGFRPALWSSVVFAVLAAATALAIPAKASPASPARISVVLTPPSGGAMTSVHDSEMTQEDALRQAAGLVDQALKETEARCRVLGEYVSDCDSNGSRTAGWSEALRELSGLHRRRSGLMLRRGLIQQAIDCLVDESPARSPLTPPPSRTAVRAQKQVQIRARGRSAS